MTTSTRHSQPTLSEWLGSTEACIHNNISPMGDPLAPRHENDGIWRCGFQNIHGTTKDHGFEVPPELDAVRSLGIDCQGMVETNCPWTPGAKWKFEMMMERVFQQSKTIFSSGTAAYDKKYQPGGNLLTINGDSTGRVNKSKGDKWGRFSYMELRGKRDEGVLVITAYRVCHEASDYPGPYTAYTHQYTEMTKAGINDPNPRKQILRDLAKLINEKRLEGYR